MKLKTGDRVRVFDIDPTSHIPRTTDGTVARVMIGTHYEGQVVEVQEDQGVMARIIAHPKSCRRLVKKPRRRVWIFVPHWGTYTEQNPAHAYPVRPCENHSEDWREFVEVRKRK